MPIDSQKAIPPAQRTLASTAATSLTLFRDHIGPALFFALFPLSRLASLIVFIERDQSDRSAILVISYFLQQVMTIGFGTFMVALFLARGPVVGRRAPLIGQVVALAGTFALQVPATFPVPDDQVGRLLLSSALVALGCGFASAGILTLRRNFGLFPEARGLVTTGLYRHVRHPLYLGEMVAGLGLTLGTTWTPAFGLFAIQCCLLYWRTILEERALTASFSAYPEYRRATRRFIPGVF